LRGIEEEPSISQSVSTKENAWRGWERAYQGGEHQIPTWNRDFPEENSNRHGKGLGTKCSSWEREKQSEKLLRREKVTGCFIDRTYQSDQSSLTNKK
jgi:hypothetical protein